MSAFKKNTTIKSYSEYAIPHLQTILDKNEAVLCRLADRLVKDVQAGKMLLVFGSGHSAIFPMELYHRAGGASFILPLFAEYLLPTAGPPVVRMFERSVGSANVLLNRVQPKPGEMLWMASQSGINGAGVELALDAKKRGLFTVAFTSVAHSSSVQSRHPSGKRLFEVCDEVVDLGGRSGDAVIEISDQIMAGPVSTLGTVMLGHSIVVTAMASLEQSGIRCTYTSVNTPEGELRNRSLEEWAAQRDVLLR